MKNREYADFYENYHINNDVSSLDYRLSYSYILSIEMLLKDYRLLDVGCGTAGYHRLLARCNYVVGVDQMPEMIKKAKILNRDLSTRSEYIVSTFDSFISIEKFEVITLSGTYGWYVSWLKSKNAIEKARNLLSPNGILIISHVPPKSVIAHLKAFFLGSLTALIKEKKITKIVESHGFKRIFKIQSNTASQYLYFQKTTPS